MSHILKDSGNREQFETGAQRDTREGKGRFDLISPVALRRLALVYERGAKKYDDHNWEKGIPMSRCLDSALRHLNQYKLGHRDEDHLAQAAWNVFSMLHFEELRPDLDDLPSYEVTGITEPFESPHTEEIVWSKRCLGCGIHMLQHSYIFVRNGKSPYCERCYQALST
jgi:hypothetical protein